MGERGNRRCMVGTVVSDRMDKTVRVDIERLVQHPRVKKYIRRKTTCYAHDPENAARAGDRVEIMETRPLSKQKRWRLVRILARVGGGIPATEGGAT